jgi:hypothetical protein
MKYAGLSIFFLINSFTNHNGGIMMKLKHAFILLILLLATSLVAQDTFVRKAVIPIPDADTSLGLGNVLAGVDFDGDGRTEIYFVNDMLDQAGQTYTPRMYKYEFNGTTWDSVWSTELPRTQNTWPGLAQADLDNDGKPEVVWTPAEGATTPSPARIYVFEYPGDGSDNMGVSDGAGGWKANTEWNFDIPDGKHMRAIKIVVADFDKDGKQEVALADRKNYFSMAIVSVSDVPDNADGSETWTLEFNGKDVQANRFVHNGEIASPDGGFGNVVAGMDYDGDGLIEMYAVNNDWNDDGEELIPTLYKYEYVNGAWIKKWGTIIPGIPAQNTWPVLLAGDWDQDGKGDIIWCPVNNLSDENPNPSRIVVYEFPGDSTSDAMGIDNGDGTWKPNAQWNMGVPDKTEMRPFSGKLADVDGDGKMEFVFAERKKFYGWGVVSVDKIPDNGDGSEVWTLKTAGGNLPSVNDLHLNFEDDSDVANWSHFDEANKYTTEAWNDTAGVDGSGALELGDAGWDFFDKRAVNATPGKDWSLTVYVKTLGWDDAHKLYLIVDGFTATDSVQINSDSVFTKFTISGTATAATGYIKIAGSNGGVQSTVYVDNLTFKDMVTPPVVGSYRDLTLLNGNIILFESNGGWLRKINPVTGDEISAQKVDIFPWRSAMTVDINNDGNDEVVIGSYSDDRKGQIVLFTEDPSADSLIPHVIVDFAPATYKQIAGMAAGDIDADSLMDFIVGFKKSGRAERVEYQGGDITDPANYTVTLLDKGVVEEVGKGQVDVVALANIDGDAADEVFFAGPPRYLDSGLEDMVVGDFGDWSITSSNWDIVSVNDGAAAVGISLGGTIYPVSFDADSSKYLLGHSQSGLNGGNGDFLSACVGDVNGDGIDEIFYAEYWGSGKVYMLMGNENGAAVSFPIADLSTLGAARLTGGAAGDIDGDGFLDLVFGTRESTPNNSVYRVEYTGGDPTDMNSWKAEVIDHEILPAGGQIDVIQLADVDEDPDLEILYTGLPRGDGYLPIVILDLQKISFEPIAAVKVDANKDGVPDRKDEIVTVKGVVTSNNFSKTGLLFTIQDTTAGIQLYDGGNDSTTYPIGTIILVTGKVGQYRGLTEIYFDPENIFALGSATPPAPIELTVAKYLEDPEKYEGSLVKINALGKVKGDWPDSGKYAGITLTDGYVENITMFVDPETGIPEQGEPTYPINLTGVCGQFTKSTPAFDGYQILPRMYSDIEQNVAAPPSPYFYFTEETKAYDGGVLEVTDSAATYPLCWHPAVDLNNEALIYQFVLLDPATGKEILATMTENNGADTCVNPTGEDIIKEIQKTGTDSLKAKVVVRTVSTNPAEGIVASVDTLCITFKDMATGVDDMNMIPKEFYVDQNYPNPFNPSTTIRFGLPKQANVTLIIYDILGREVVKLISNQVMNAGNYKYTFNASNLASGTYIYRLQADNKVQVKKMLLLK